MIVVPRFGEVAATGVGDDSSALRVVNINTATEQELDALPGIGEARANRIIVSRQDDGLFTTIEDLLVRELIPDSVFEEIAPLISVN
jgi:competence protein ComEA